MVNWLGNKREGIKDNCYKLRVVVRQLVSRRSGKDGEYYFVEIESRDEFDKLRELTLKKLEIEKLLKKE